MEVSDHALPDLGVERLCMAPSLRCSSAKVTAAKGSVIGYTGAAIVNAANEGCLGGGGIDGAIGSAGGAALYAARKALLWSIDRTKRSTQIRQFLLAASGLRFEMNLRTALTKHGLWTWLARYASLITSSQLSLPTADLRQSLPTSTRIPSLP